MLTTFLSALAAIMTSWLAGLLLMTYLKKRPMYAALSDLQFIRSQSLYKAIGIRVFKWLVTKTVYRHLNYNLKLSDRPYLNEIKTVRNAMTDSEILHGIAFILVIIAGFPTLIYSGDGSLWAWVSGLNILLNLYPTLLQQYNKAKLDKVIFYLEQKVAEKSVALTPP